MSASYPRSCSSFPAVSIALSSRAKPHNASLRDPDPTPCMFWEWRRHPLRIFRVRRSGACGTDRFLPLSCKRRTVCAGCGGRRMAECAAHLVDHVFPDVPVRQWVLSLPHRLRYQFAWSHDLSVSNS